MSQEVVEASAAQLHVALQGRNKRVGCAESLTGGELAAWLSSTPGASRTFTGAVVSYAGEVKRDVLGVTAERVVSSDCAEQMAIGVRQLLGVDWALSTTGVAGPDEQEGQAVGTVYVGIASTQRVRSVRLALEGDRVEIRRAVCSAALQLLLQEVTHG
jgi:nicotinamide-nucleotide amidase